LIRPTSSTLFGVILRSYGRGADKKSIVDVARVCDEEGYQSVWAAERLLVPDPPNQDWSKTNRTAFEELTLLSYVAGMTQKVKLGTYVLLAPLRNPLVLLRQVTTLDVLSNGRVILGLGLGWMKEEFETSGIPIASRGKRTDDVVRFLRKAWTSTQPVSYSSPFIKMSSSFLEPAPVQKPVPIWIGGMSTPALKRAGRSGDGWLPNAVLAPEVVRSSIETISTEAKRCGRDPKGVAISCRLTFNGTKAEIPGMKRSIELLRQVGVDLFILDFGQPSGDDSVKANVFSREVMKSF